MNNLSKNNYIISSEELPIIPCSSYQPNFVDLFIPPITLFYNTIYYNEISSLCISYDRTNMIFISILRLFIYIYINHYINLKNIKFEYANILLRFILFIIILINLLCLFISFYKNPLYPTEYEYINIDTQIQNITYQNNNYINTDDYKI
jgi:hypothetical protein